MDLKNNNLFINSEENLLVKCFFCEEIFPDKQLQSHITNCQSVLEKCPQKCGVYITRHQRDFHVKKQCSKIKVNDAPTIKMNNECVCCEYCSKNINEIETELKIIQLRIDDERRNRLQFEYTWLNELSKLHERHQRNEDWHESIFSVLSTLRKGISQEEQIRLREVDEISIKLDKISLVLKNLEICINEIDDVIKETKTNCSLKNEELLDQLDELRLKQENRLASLRNLNKEFEKLREDHISRSCSLLQLLDINEILIENQEQCSEQVKICGKDIETFKGVLNEETHLINSTRNKQLDHFEHLKGNFEKTNCMLQELLTWKKFITKKLTEIESTIRCTNVIQDPSQNSITFHPTDTPVYSNGHLIWCVLDFEEQFEESKLANVILQSPVFYTSEYGYKLQMRLHPNGLGQWKGRHMIISLHVLQSDWDSLLVWPFKINATVVVRDQTSDNEHAKNVVKCFGNNIVNKSNESTKVLQMFVPHRSLRENTYVYNNSIILEAQVKIIISD